MMRQSEILSEILEKSRDHEAELMKRSLIITSPDDNFNKGYQMGTGRNR